MLPKEQETTAPGHRPAWVRFSATVPEPRLINPRALGLTREGLYRLKVVPGLSRATLDESATRTVWLRIVR